MSGLAGLTDPVVADGLGRLGRMPDALVAPADGPRVAGVLSEAVPELADGRLRLERCDPKLRLKHGGAWTAHYRLLLVGASGERQWIRLTGEYRPARVASSALGTVQGALGSPGWSAELPALGLSLAHRHDDEDEDLPALAVLTDPERASHYLEQALHPRWPGARIETCTAEVMRYKPGSRCTVRYELGYEGGAAGPARVVAKTYRGDKGANAYRGMVALDAACIPSETVELASALAYDPEARVLVQQAVNEERTLKELAQQAGAEGTPASFAELSRQVVKAAAGLAAVHRSGVVHGEVVTWEDQWHEVAELADRLADPVPETAGTVNPYLDQLTALGAEHPADPAGPAHRSFRPAQVLLAGGRIAFIDFDGLCTAEPAMDVALFRAALRDAVVRAVPELSPAVLAHRLAALDEVCDEFLARYRDPRARFPGSRRALGEPLPAHVGAALLDQAPARPARPADGSPRPPPRTMMQGWRVTIASTVAVGVFSIGCSNTDDPPEARDAVPGSAPADGGRVVPVVETQPVPHSDDAADDPAIWVDPADPSRSAVIGTDKDGGLAVYDLAGHQLQYVPDGRLNNVDLRDGFALGGAEMTLVTAGNRGDNTIAVYRFDPATRRLEDVAARPLKLDVTIYGSCMYRSTDTRKTYFFATSEAGDVEQWELFDAGGKVDGRSVRTLRPESGQSEGCVADDDLGRLYVAEEEAGIWRYGAEPDDGADRTRVDSTGDGRLVADVEGLAIARGEGTAGWLVASSQGDSAFAVYERDGVNKFVHRFKIGEGQGIDAVGETDGIDVTTANLGGPFTGGVFVAQDGSNPGGNQNFKLVPWDSIVSRN